jgi:hypothetical protein
MGAKQSVVKAAGKGNMDRVQHHIKKRGRAVLFEKEPGGWTALHKAARKGKAEMVEYLIEKMADIESIDAAMMTPLHCACWKGHTEVVEKLLEKGANALVVTESGWNPIHTAAFRGHADVVKVLLSQSELNPGQRDLQGFTALEITDCDSVAELLEQAGFNVIQDMMDDDDEIFLEVDGEEGRSAEDIQATAQRKGVDIYALLGLPPDATAQQVKDAYKRLAGKYASLRPSSAQRKRPSSAEARRPGQRHEEGDAMGLQASLDGERVEYVPPSMRGRTSVSGAGEASPKAAAHAGGEGAEALEEEDAVHKVERQLVAMGYASHVLYASVHVRMHVRASVMPSQPPNPKPTPETQTRKANSRRDAQHQRLDTHDPKP